MYSRIAETNKKECIYYSSRSKVPKQGNEYTTAQDFESLVSPQICYNSLKNLLIPSYTPFHSTYYNNSDTLTGLGPSNLDFFLILLLMYTFLIGSNTFLKYKTQKLNQLCVSLRLAT